MPSSIVMLCKPTPTLWSFVMTTIAEISGWHNVSTNENVNIPGVTVEDVLSILRAIQNHKNVIIWQQFIDDLHNHVIDKENPHNVTIDQLKTTVIQLFYEKWLSEGYSGTLSDFITILFNYIEYATQEEMNLGEEENKVPPVAIFAEYIRLHNVNPDAHESKINGFFIGDSDTSEPVFSYHQFIGIPKNVSQNINAENTYYENVQIHEGYPAKEFSLILGFVPVDGSIAKIFDNTSFIEVSCDTLTSTVTCVYKLDDTNEYQCSVNIPEDVARVCLKYTDFTLTLTSYLENGVIEIVELRTIEETDTGEEFIPKRPRTPAWPKLTLRRMQPGDPLRDCIYYHKHLSQEQVLYVLEILD